MSRSVSEWAGATDDSKPPPRVRLRVFNRHDGRCQCGCGRKIMAGEAWELDHVIALTNGGENRESNMAPLLVAHHRDKTARDVAEKSRVYRKRSKHVGIRKSSYRPIPGSKASGLRKRMDGTVERR